MTAAARQPSTLFRCDLRCRYDFGPFCDVVLQSVAKRLGRSSGGYQAQRPQSTDDFGIADHVVYFPIESIDDVGRRFCVSKYSIPRCDFELLQPVAVEVASHRPCRIALSDGNPECLKLPYLALLEERAPIDATSYPYFHLVRGTLLGEVGRTEEARLSMREAHRCARNESEHAQIRARIDALDGAEIENAP